MGELGRQINKIFNIFCLCKLMTPSTKFSVSLMLCQLVYIPGATIFSQGSLWAIEGLWNNWSQMACQEVHKKRLQYSNK